MKGEPLWLGKEVEGRWTGLETIFIRCHKEKLAKTTLQTAAHVYFTFEYVENATDDNWDLIRHLLFRNKPVTVECFAKGYKLIPADIKNAVHIILRVPAEHIDDLKPTDTVTLDERPYRVYTATKWQLQEVKEDAYSADVALHAIDEKRIQNLLDKGLIE